MKSLLLEILKSRVDAPGWAWLEKALAACEAPVHLNTLLGYYAGASRRIGKQALDLTEAESSKVKALHPDVVLDNWGADEAARAVLMLSLATLPPEEFVELVHQCYEKGDSREQESWLRGLVLLPGAERFLDAAVDACRTNIVPLFEAIACENPYPRDYFPELNFNQLVMKALFLGPELSRVMGLEQRTNGELSRMTNDYVSEREAAGRAVPADIWLALVAHASPEATERAYRYLNHEQPEHRYWLALGLGGTGKQEHKEALTARIQIEQEPRVQQALKDSLSNLG